MTIKIDNVEIAEYPAEFTVTVFDLDSSESTVRTADGILNRDRVAVKRTIKMSWGILVSESITSILQAMSAPFFDLYYFDPMDGAYVTKTFYVGNRPVTSSLIKDGVMFWKGLDITLTER